MPKPNLSDAFRLNERYSITISYLVVSGMMVCAAIPVIQLAQRLTPGWEGGYLVGACFVATLEAMISRRTVDRFSLFSPPWLTYRGAELVIILVGLKALLYSRRGFDQLLADLPRWLKNVNSFFEEGEYLFAGLLMLAIWLLGGWFAGALIELEGDEQQLEDEREGQLTGNRSEARRQLISYVFVVGGGMLFLTALLRSNLSFLGLNTAVVQTGLLNVVLYFVLGLVLLSQSQFAVLRARWSLERIPISGSLAPRWAVSSAVLLVCVAAVVSLLPTRYSVGLLGALGYLASLILTILYILVFLIVAPFVFLFGLLFRLFGQASASPPPVFQLPNVGPVTPVPSTSVSWFEALKSLIFWSVFLGVLGYSLYYYLRQRQDVMGALRQLPAWSWFVNVWRSLWGGLRGINQDIVGALQAGLRRLRPARLIQPWRYLGVRRLSPRDQIRFFYLALIRRGGESGLPRWLSQTPYEYERDLSATLPEASDDLAAITNAYVEAQYSRHEITPPKANSIREHWERIRRALRSHRRRPG